MAVAERIYANALFESAKEQDKLEAVRGELAEFVAAMEQVPELRALLENPEIDTKERVDALRSILAGADETVRNFLLLVSEKGRAHELPRDRARARRTRRSRGGDPGRRAHDRRRAVGRRRRAGSWSGSRGASERKLRATRSVDPSLIGGFVLQAGSHRVDASVRARLQNLRRQLTGTGRS